MDLPSPEGTNPVKVLPCAAAVVHTVPHSVQEHFLPHFSQAGWDCYAVSLRGQGGSERPEGMKSGGSLASHADDLHSVVGSLPRAPVIIAHSFGGLLAQRYGVVGRILGKSAVS